jgi:phosphoglycolate phosphatase-like HAD superfamily hydrolase
MFAAQFEAALHAELANSPAQFREIPGAFRLLAYLEELGWNFACATGGWARTARLKLQAAHLPTHALLASSDDSADRLTIFSLARDRARRAEEGVVLVGDGAWDVKVARTFGWSFVGVGRNARETMLRTSGARAVIPDFSELQNVVALLGTASRVEDEGD